MLFSSCRSERSGKCSFRRNWHTGLKGPMRLGPMQRSFSKSSCSPFRRSRKPRVCLSKSHRPLAQQSREDLLAMSLQGLVILAIAGLFTVPLGAAQDQPVQEASVAEQVGTSSEISPGHLVVIYKNGELTIKANKVSLLE